MVDLWDAGQGNPPEEKEYSDKVNKPRAAEDRIREEANKVVEKFKNHKDIKHALFMAYTEGYIKGLERKK